MEMTQERDGNVVVVKAVGRLDSAAVKTAEDGFDAAIGRTAPHLVVDMSGLEYISSAGLRVLLMLAKKVQTTKGKLALYGLQPNVKAVFAVSGFDTILSVQADRAAALAAVR
jgi:anti-anti-sigma factor